MLHQDDPRTPAQLAVRRVVPAAVIVQALISLVAWFLVDERPDMPALSTNDFETWMWVNLVSAVLLAILGGLALRRWWVIAAVALGSLVAVSSACAAFLLYAVLNSA